MHDHTQIQQHLLGSNEQFPNNPKLPLLLYLQAVILESANPATLFERLFNTHQWGNGWRSDVYGFHHYHSTAHEVLGVYRGQAKLQFGGDNGIQVAVKAGDVVLIPAGVAHKKLCSNGEFAVVGAYPVGQSWDMCTGKAGERPQADHNVASVPLPEADPVLGQQGGLAIHWQ